jgi:hypothetical protein
MKRRNGLLFGCLCALVLAAPVCAQSIDTFPAWNGSNALDRWGAVNDTPTFGQSFTATASLNNLTNMTFSMALTRGTQVLQYQAYVFAWTGSNISGSALFTSGLQTTPNSAAQTQVSVATGGVPLTPGQQYVAFFSTNGIADPSSGYNWGMLGTSVPGAADGYAGGNLVFNNNTDVTFSGGWNNPSFFGANPGADFAFRFDFTAGVPEPATWALMGVTGAIVSGTYYIRRRLKSRSTRGWVS